LRRPFECAGHLVVVHQGRERVIDLYAERAAGGADAEARAATRFREIVRYFEEDVNGMTVRRFGELLAATPSLRSRRVHYEPPKFKFLRPLLHVPPLREYLAGLVFADLERLGTPALSTPEGR